MSGMIQGGWEFVYAAYGITGGALALYALSLFVRLRRSPPMQMSRQEQSDLPVAASEDEPA